MGRRWGQLGMAAALGMGVAAVARRVSKFSGATREEADSALPGDEVIVHPRIEWTRGITIDASPAEIWPWLLQMGYGRAGFYAPRWIDERVFGIPCTNRHELVPELQHLSAGEILADGPDYAGYWHVVDVQPRRAIVLWSRRHPWRGHPVDPDDRAALARREQELLVGGTYIDFSWTFVLRELTPGRTRLLLRTRGHYSPPWLGAVPFGLADAYIAGAELRAIKRNVERNRAAPVERPFAVHLAELEPTDENLARAALLHTPCIVFLVAPSLDEFRAARERLRRHNPALRAAWAVIPRQSLMVSRFADAGELDELTAALKSAGEKLTVLFDFEIPFWEPSRLARPGRLRESARAVDRLLTTALERHEVYTSEWPPVLFDWPRSLRLTLPLAQDRTYQLYSTMMPRWWRALLRHGLARRFESRPGAVGVGTLAEPQGTYRDLTPAELERDIREAIR